MQNYLNLEHLLAELPQPEQRCMEYLYQTMPLSDKVDYSFELFLTFATHSLHVRNTMPWCKSLDEDLFYPYVLYHRVNNENISECRSLFFHELADRVCDLSVPEAVLEVNRWCHEKASYQSQDDRTASPLTVYLAGSGRCGEESVFLVSALRSVGIAARQVYAPRWSHCDDNHAWVECWCEDNWYFLGACEPEPVLNRGWFNVAASRAMLVHSRTFGESGCAGEVPSGYEGCTSVYNQTSRYALTLQYTFSVEDEAGQPIIDATVHLELLNESRFIPIAVLKTDSNGKAVIKMGIGDVMVRANKDGQTAFAICHGAKEVDMTLILRKETLPDLDWCAFDFAAPSDHPVNPSLLNETQKALRANCLSKGNTLRNNRISSFCDPDRVARFPALESHFRLARGNLDELYTFVEFDNNSLRTAILETISEKDHRDITAKLLESYITATAPYQTLYSSDLFTQYILCPRVADEMLTPYHAFLDSAFSTSEKAAFRKNPILVWHYIEKTIAQEFNNIYDKLTISPEGVLRAGRADEQSRRILFVCICRTLGIPARLNPIDGIPEYWKDDKFISAIPMEQAVAVFTSSLDTAFLYHQNWSVTRIYDDDRQQILDLSGYGWHDGKLEVALSCGNYYVVTTNRLPNGNQLAYTYSFVLKPDSYVEVALRLRESKIEDMLEHCTLPAFSAQTKNGETLNSSQILDYGMHLLFWLEEGAEPTEHVLNELLPERERIANLGIVPIFFLRNKEALQQETIAHVLKNCPEIRLFFGDWDYNLETLSRRMYCDPDRPPLILACDHSGSCIYACNGYNVGAVDMLIRVLEHSTKFSQH